MSLWYDESNNRRGGLGADDFAKSISDAVAILTFLANSGPSTAAQVTAGVSGMTLRRSGLLLDSLVAAGGATVSTGTYTGVLVKAT